MKWFFVFVLFGLGIVIFGSCNPCKRLARKCPSHDSTSVVVETIRDTVWIETPADSLSVVVPITVIEELGELGLTVESDDQKIVVKIVHDTLFVESECKEDSLQAIIEHLKTTVSTTKTIYEEVEVEKEVIRNSKFARFAIYFFLLVIVVIGAWVYIKIKSGAVKAVLKRIQNPWVK